MLGEMGTDRSILLPIKKHFLPGSCPLWINTIVSIVTEMVWTSKEPISSTEQNQMNTNVLNTILQMKWTYS